MPDTAASASMMDMALSGARVAMAPGVTGDSSVVTTIIGAVGATETACVGASDTVGVGAGVLGSPTVNEVVLVSRSVVLNLASDFTV